MAVYTVQSITEAGLNPTMTAVSATDTFAPAAADYDKAFILHVVNGGGSPDSCAVDDPNSTTNAPGSTAYNPDITVSVTNAQSRFIRLNPIRRFVNTGTGNVTVTHSFTTSVTAAVYVA
jgi:hypothetical protein